MLVPLCKDCESHFMKYHLEIAGVKQDVLEELPSMYRATPTCPACGLIGDVKKSKLQDALMVVKRVDDEGGFLLDFMAFYRKRGKDFQDGYSIVRSFLTHRN